MLILRLFAPSGGPDRGDDDRRADGADLVEGVHLGQMARGDLVNPSYETCWITMAQGSITGAPPGGTEPGTSVSIAEQLGQTFRFGWFYLLACCRLCLLMFCNWVKQIRIINLHPLSRWNKL